MSSIKSAIVIALLSISYAIFADPVGSVFTYQGELRKLGEPANGTFDFQFELFDVETDGAALAGPLQLEDVNVQGGVFTVELDFGSEAFDGSELWLDIGVRDGLSDADFSTLTPRQLITASPYAVKALTPSCSLSSCVAPGLATITCGASSLDVSCVPACVPDCTGLQCGDDGCGGSCGTCAVGEDCIGGMCLPGCVPDCTGLQCGDDGCGGSCGTCVVGEDCIGGTCLPGCVPDCTGLQCGDDGCGGICGTCAVGEDCIGGTCISSG
jgi:hypothetical protein